MAFIEYKCKFAPGRFVVNKEKIKLHNGYYEPGHKFVIENVRSFSIYGFVFKTLVNLRDSENARKKIEVNARKLKLINENN